MGWSSYEFVEGREVCYQADPLSVRLGNEESRAAPSHWFVDGGDDPLSMSSTTVFFDSGS